MKILETNLVCRQVGKRIEVDTLDEFVLKQKHANWWSKVLKIISST